MTAATPVYNVFIWLITLLPVIPVLAPGYVLVQLASFLVYAAMVTGVQIAGVFSAMSGLMSSYR